jgi:hypothetical protein
VGMHPDQATDAVVDAALALGCPFAVVPCCVFPALFAETRRTPDGRRVTTRRVPRPVAYWQRNETAGLALMHALSASCHGPGRSWSTTCWRALPGRAQRGCRSRAQTAWCSRRRRSRGWRKRPPMELRLRLRVDEGRFATELLPEAADGSALPADADCTPLCVVQAGAPMLLRARARDAAGGAPEPPPPACRAWSWRPCVTWRARRRR